MLCFLLAGCITTEWGSWGNCSQACGKGFKNRTREFVDPDDSSRSECNKTMLEYTETCFEKPCAEGRVSQGEGTQIIMNCNLRNNII